MQTDDEEVRIALNRSGFYELRWTEVQGNGAYRTRSRSLRTRDRNDAEAQRSAWIAARRVVENQNADKTIQHIVDEYTQFHLNADGKPNTQIWALRAIARHLGNETLLSLDRHMVQLYVNTRRTERRKGRIAADGTIRRELGALVAALNWAVKNGVLPQDTILPHIALPAEGQARENYLDHTTEERLWNLASAAVRPGGRKWRIGLFICLALETAARSRAIETLEWSRVDLATDLIDYRDVSVRRSKKRRVPVPISARLKPVLARAKSFAQTPWVLGHNGSTRKAFDTFMADVKINASRHDLRRTWATLAAQDGVDLYQIAGMLGDTIETVTKHYAHHSPAYLRGAVDRQRRTPPAAPKPGTPADELGLQ